MTETSKFPQLAELPKGLQSLGLSIDLETPVTSGAGILSAGLVPFDELTGIVYDNCALYVRCRTAEVLDAGHINGSTLLWWMEQREEARAELYRDQKSAMPYASAIADVLGYMHEIRNTMFNPQKAMLMPLGNSNRFDLGILEATALALELVPKNERGEKQLPWAFWNELDLRTREYDCRMFAGKNVRDAVMRRGTHHNAVDDAVFQAAKFIAAGQLLGGKEVNVIYASERGKNPCE